MSAWDETALEQACRDLPAKVRLLRGRSRHEAQTKLVQMLVAIKRLAEEVLNEGPEPPQSEPPAAEAAKAFANARRIVSGIVRRPK